MTVYSRLDIDGSGWEIYVINLGANTPSVGAWAVCADVG